MTTRITLPPLPIDKQSTTDGNPTSVPNTVTPSAPIAIPIPLSIAIPSRSSNYNNNMTTSFNFSHSSFHTPSSSPTLSSPFPIPLGSPHSLGRRRLDAFHIITLIGRGGFGKVFLVRHKATHQIYAMKVMDKESLIEKRAVNDAHSERNILAMLGESNTPFIIKLHIAFQTKRRIYLVMDFASGGELMFHLRKEHLLDEEDCKFYAAQLLIALKLLHEKHIIHRDIKPENVLIDNQGHLVLTDFGLAKQLSIKEDHNNNNGDNSENHSWCGSEDYMAPEIIGNHKHTGIPADYWAFGIFIFDCLCGHPPFSKGKINKRTLHNRILKSKLKLPPFLSPHAHNLLKKLLTKDMRKRLTDPMEIQNHPWFASINWNALINKQIKPPIIPPASSPTACFSPSLTKSTYSVPHSPLDSYPNLNLNHNHATMATLTSTATATTAMFQATSTSSSSSFKLRNNSNRNSNSNSNSNGSNHKSKGHMNCSNKSVDGQNQNQNQTNINNNNSSNHSGSNVWKGFSFVAPGMEVHFELAPPAVDRSKQQTVQKTAHFGPIVLGASPEIENALCQSINDVNIHDSANNNHIHGHSVVHGDELLSDHEHESLEAELAEFSEDAKQAVEIFEN